MKALLKAIQPIPRSGSDLRNFRALEVLELIGSGPALEILEQQAAQATQSWMAEEARWSRDRLKNRRSP